MYRSFHQRRFCIGVFLGCLLLPWLLQAQVAITLDRSSIPAGEAAQLTVSVEGSDLNSYPEIPPVDGLSFAQASIRQTFQSVNGVNASKINISYHVRTSKPGAFTIGPVKVKAGGKVHQSQPVMLTVTPAAKAAAPPAEEANKQAFLQLSTPKRELYVGEVFPLEVNLFFQNARGEMPQVKSDGFSLSAQPLHTQDRVRLPNGIYQRHNFRYVAKALKTGDQELGPAQCNLQVQIPVRDVDPVFGGMIQSYRFQAMNVKSEVLNLKVMPLPEAGRPASFNGALGRFTFRTVATKNEVAVGDPVILQVEIGGAGTWDSVQLPPTDDWRDFKIYPPNSEFKPLDDLGIQGVKRFELVVVPENSAVKEIPAMAFSFFDTDARKYQTINVAAIPLKVRASSGAPAQPTVTSGTVKAASEEPAAAKDILHIKPHLGTVMGIQAPAVASPWFWGL
ncbi:MAG: BatD family protein, partial [Verrucomicrobiota bacterium]